MHRFWRPIRFSVVGVVASGVVLAVQGCDFREVTLTLLTLIALVLSTAGGGEGEYIEITATQTVVDLNFVLQSQNLTFRAVVNNAADVDAFLWTFGDGQGGTGQTVTHAYTSPGSYEVTVSVVRGTSQQTLTTTIEVKDVVVPLTLSAAGTGSGGVVGAPNSINCTITGGSSSGTCSDFVLLGSVHTLTATPAADFVFDSWTNCSNPASNVCQQTVTADTTVTANFLELFTLTVIVDTGAGNPSVVSDIGGINCLEGETCTAQFPSGTVVQLTAIEAGGALFSQWSNCVSPNSSSKTINVTMNADKTCNTSFVN